MQPMKFIMSASTLLATALIVSQPGVADVNIYSYRQAHLIEPVLQKFTAETGIRTNVVYAKEGVAERLKREDRNSPADIVLTTEIGQLLELVDQNLTQPLSSQVVASNVPAAYRAEDNQWIGLTLRVRNIYASKAKNIPLDLDYEDLAEPRFKGKVCTRSGKHPYNIGLISAMIASKGEAETQKWLEGVKANLARKPQGNDREQVKAIKEGLCDVSLGNSYYYGAMLSEPEQKPWAEAVNIIFPNQDNRGAHVNVSGVAMAKYAPNHDSALALIDYLTGTEAQQIYAEVNFEYPVKEGVKPSALVSSWGDFKKDEVPLTETAKYRNAAVKLLDRVDFDG
jgi:iron(III) transport system substrate-binding protein